jgi:hypothetical protein
MLSLPPAAEPLLLSFAPVFTKPTFQRVLVLVVGAILTLGRHTVTGILWTVRCLAVGHYSSYHRVLSRAPWRLLPLGRILAAAVLELVPRDQPIVVPGDDTTPQHKGKNVYGKGCHRDACRSTHGHVVWVWGHRWVVLAINVRFPFAWRPWALPVLAALYRPEELNRQEGRRHRTALDLARQLLACLIHWFPERKFIFVGDGGYGSHELAAFCHRHRRHLTLVSRFHPQASLYAPPANSHRRKVGRPRIRGRRLAKPQSVVQSAKRTRATVQWYGGASRRIEYVSGTGLWYKGGQGLVPVRWVFVHDLSGTHRDEYFYSTDPGLTPVQIIDLYTGRWSIEVTFQEMRFHLGFATPRSWRAPSVLRTVPCLLGLFSVVCLIFAEDLKHHRPQIRIAHWYHKSEPTFADAIAQVRRLFWAQTIFARADVAAGVKQFPSPLRRMLLDQLSRAA